MGKGNSDGVGVGLWVEPARWGWGWWGVSGASKAGSDGVRGVGVGGAS